MAGAPFGRLRDDFAALVAAGERTDLARAALAIARIGHPDLDPAPSLRRLDALAAAVRPRVVPGMPPASAVAELAHHLFEECHFRGNRDDYYDPRNSYLNDVLERRVGIPITLSVVMIEVGARLDLALEGVGFPGHFLVRVAGSRPPLLLDPFFGGRRVDDEELLTRYRGVGPRDATAVPAEALETTDTRGILLRMLRNLLHVHLDRQAAEDSRQHALLAADLLLVLAPHSAEEHRVRGLLYEQLECFGAALDDFRSYLELAPDAPDADQIRERVARLVRVAATIH
jgi:regulator of sirC expression with transglutaminase-like and TPR domain